MRKLRFGLILLGVAVVAIPASATITYSYCTSGCSATGGSYSAWQSQGSGLTFTSQIDFVTAGLNTTTGVYTDGGTGTVFTSYNGSVVDAQATVNNGVFEQAVEGSSTGIQITLPANTYAFAMYVSTCSYWYNCSSFPYAQGGGTAALGTESSRTTPAYTVTIPDGGPSQMFAIVSSTPITSVFLASSSNEYIAISSFEIGQDSPTPEASTFFTLGSGLIGLYFFRRPRRPRNSPDRTLHN